MFRKKAFTWSGAKRKELDSNSSKVSFNFLPETMLVRSSFEDDMQYASYPIISDECCRTWPLLWNLDFLKASQSTIMVLCCHFVHATREKEYFSFKCLMDWKSWNVVSFFKIPSLICRHKRYCRLLPLPTGSFRILAFIFWGHRRKSINNTPQRSVFSRKVYSFFLRHLRQWILLWCCLRQRLDYRSYSQKPMKQIRME